MRKKNIECICYSHTGTLDNSVLLNNHSLAGEETSGQSGQQSPSCESAV